MASQWLKARQTKYAAYATVYILVVIAGVVVANTLADRYNKSFDATTLPGLALFLGFAGARARICSINTPTSLLKCEWSMSTRIRIRNWHGRQGSGT